MQGTGARELIIVWIGGFGFGFDFGFGLSEGGVSSFHSFNREPVMDSDGGGRSVPRARWPVLLPVPARGSTPFSGYFRPAFSQISPPSVTDFFSKPELGSWMPMAPMSKFVRVQEAQDPDHFFGAAVEGEANGSCMDGTSSPRKPTVSPMVAGAIQI